MVEEFKKSVNSILYERINSPFWGAVITSWIILNWEIIYVTLFIPSEKLTENKVEYIKEYSRNNLDDLTWKPIVAVIFLLVVVPLISYCFYWLHLTYNNWKVDLKRRLEKKIPLTIEDSIKLRDEIHQYEMKFLKLTQKKDEEISNLLEEIKLYEEENNKLKGIIQDYKNQINQFEKNEDSIRKQNEFHLIFKGDWVYKIGEETKQIFRIVNKNEFEFRGKDRALYDLRMIRKTGDDKFEILVYPQREYIEKDDNEIRILSINRTENVEEFKGIEYLIWKEENNVKIRESEITLYKKI